MLYLKEIEKYYGKNDYRQEVLKEIGIHIEEGKMVSIMGPSGSGKSTLLNILGLLDDNFSGEYRLDGEKVSDLSEKERAVLRNEKIGFVFQSFHLIKELTAFENVQMGLLLANVHKPFGKKWKKSEIREKSKEMLALMGLQEHLNKKASQLSGGQQQRVAIARGLVNEPKIILADEPTGALDQKNGKEIMEIFRKLNRQGKTIVIVTHDKNVASYCERNLNMLDGQFV